MGRRERQRADQEGDADRRQQGWKQPSCSIDEKSDIGEPAGINPDENGPGDQVTADDKENIGTGKPPENAGKPA
jgi:hypothetical protein